MLWTQPILPMAQNHHVFLLTADACLCALWVGGGLGSAPVLPFFRAPLSGTSVVTVAEGKEKPNGALHWCEMPRLGSAHKSLVGLLSRSSSPTHLQSWEGQSFSEPGRKGLGGLVLEILCLQRPASPAALYPQLSATRSQKPPLTTWAPGVGRQSPKCAHVCTWAGKGFRWDWD